MRLLVNQRLLQPFLDLVFPPVCVGCGRVDSLLCPTCTASFTAQSIPASERPETLRAVYCIAAHEGAMQRAIWALKYEHQQTLSKPLGALAASVIATLQWPESIVLPVPLHPNRLQQRGYNQASLIGQQIAENLHWPYDDITLIRTKDTASQVGLGRAERQQNVHAAFSLVDSKHLPHSNVILVDDVYTTGATLNACAIVLLKAGARTVRAVALGRAGFADSGLST